MYFAAEENKLTYLEEENVGLNFALQVCSKLLATNAHSLQELTESNVQLLRENEEYEKIVQDTNENIQSVLLEYDMLRKQKLQLELENERLKQGKHLITSDSLQLKEDISIAADIHRRVLKENTYLHRKVNENKIEIYSLRRKLLGANESGGNTSNKII